MMFREFLFGGLPTRGVAGGRRRSLLPGRNRVRVVAVCALALIPSSAFGLCLLDTRLPVEFERSDAVLIGTVIAARHVGESKGYYDGDFYTVRVREVFRGTVSKTIRVFSENTSGRFPMEIGAKYVLFLDRAPDGRFMVDNCGNSARLPDGEATVEAVRQLAKVKRSKFTTLEPGLTAPQKGADRS